MAPPSSLFTFSNFTRRGFTTAIPPLENVVLIRGLSESAALAADFAFSGDEWKLGSVEVFDRKGILMNLLWESFLAFFSFFSSLDNIFEFI